MKTILVDPEENSPSKSRNNKRKKQEITTFSPTLGSAMNYEAFVVNHKPIENNAFAVDSRIISQDWLSNVGKSVLKSENIPIIGDGVFSLGKESPFQVSLGNDNIYGIGKPNNNIFISTPLPAIPDQGLTKKEILNLLAEERDEYKKTVEKEIGKAVQAQIEKITTNTNTGLQFIKDKLKTGYRVHWRCAACRETIEIFTDNNGFLKMKYYLEKFSKGEYCPCPKRSGKHLNWFEIKENQILWHTQASFDTEIRPLKP